MSITAAYSNSAIAGTQTPSLAFTGGGAWIDAIVRVEFIRNPASMRFDLR